MENICIFAASSAALEEKYIHAAYTLGRLFAEKGFGLVFGGGRTGLMGACARGVKEAGGRAIGVIPERLNVPGIPYEGCDELIVTRDMHERKARMESMSMGYVALPGGFGTLEELMEVLTLNQLGYLKAPVVILNQDGFYQQLIAQLNTFVKRGFTNQAYLGLFTVAQTPEEAVEQLTRFRLPDLPDKIKEAVKDHGKRKTDQ